jgi:heme/copper-type cytochrome/quinol oxidase subunit 4
MFSRKVTDGNLFNVINKPLTCFAFRHVLEQIVEPHFKISVLFFFVFLQKDGNLHYKMHGNKKLKKEQIETTLLRNKRVQTPKGVGSEKKTV